MTLASFCIFLFYNNHCRDHCADREKLAIKFAHGKIFSACFPQKKNIAVSTIKNITEINCFMSPYSFYKSSEKQAKTIKTFTMSMCVLCFSKTSM